LNSKRAFVNPIGGIQTSAAVDTVVLFCRSFTGDPEN